MTKSTGGETFGEIFWQTHCDRPREAPGGEVYTAQAWGYREYYQQYTHWYSYAFFILQNVNPGD